jgi:hypothetical protein
MNMKYTLEVYYDKELTQFNISVKLTLSSSTNVFLIDSPVWRLFDSIIVFLTKDLSSFWVKDERFSFGKINSFIWVP